MFYAILVVCILGQTAETFFVLKGLVAKQRAGDLLKRKIIQMTTFLCISAILGFAMSLIYVMREGVWKRKHLKDTQPEAYYISSLPFDITEFFFILVLWIPTTLENSPRWCGNWFRKEHW